MSHVNEFVAFHRGNPHVYERIVNLARAAVDRGAAKLGMKQLFEVLLWEVSMRTRDWTEFKLNNNYTSYYARLVMHREADLAGIFDVRQQRDEFDPGMLDGTPGARLF
jgi:hypothetical protein